MSVKSKIRWIKSELNHITDPLLIEIFVKLLKYRKPSTKKGIEEYNHELDEANKRIDLCKYVSQEDLEKESSQW